MARLKNGFAVAVLASLPAIRLLMSGPAGLPHFSLADTNGREHTPAEWAARRAVVQSAVVQSIVDPAQVQHFAAAGKHGCLRSVVAPVKTASDSSGSNS